MNEYQVGKDVGELKAKIEHLERLVQDLVGAINNVQNRLQLLETQRKD